MAAGGLEALRYLWLCNEVARTLLVTLVRVVLEPGPMTSKSLLVPPGVRTKRQSDTLEPQWLEQLTVPVAPPSPFP